MSIQERDIKTVSFGLAVRLRKGMYLSADNSEALFLALREAYVNSLDSFVETNQKNGIVEIEINSQLRTVKVKDNGPGIPIKIREDGTNSLIAAYTISHSGSHFDERKTNAAGLNGIGAKCVLYTSKEFQVTSCDGEKCAHAEFKADEKEGAILKSYQEIKNLPPKTGVTLSYIPDPEVFEDAWFDKETLKKEFFEMMKFYPNSKLIFTMDGESTTYNYPNGLREKTTVMYYESENLILSLNTEGGGIRPYGNRLYLPNGGNFVSHFKTQFTKMVNEASGLKLKGDQIQALFGGYLAIFVSPVLFSNQSKTSVSNKEVNPEITSALRSEMEKFVKTPAWDRIVKNLEAEAKAEAAAERAREKVLKAKKDFADKKINAMSEKFCDTDFKDRTKTRLFICEGLSVASAIKRIKWPIDGVLELRGKTLNTSRYGWDKVIENNELMLIAKAIGATMTDAGFLLSEKNLRFNQIILAADDDVDGNHIISLLMAFFYNYFPSLYKQEHIQIIAPKLFKATFGKEVKWFGTEQELKDYEKLNKKKPSKVERFKGRGSMDFSELAEILDPEKGEFWPITLKDAAAARESMKLMEEDVSARKDLLNSGLGDYTEDE